MKSGKLTEEIMIERSTNTVDPDGTPVLAWEQIARLRAEKVEQSTTEYIRNAGANDEEVIVFRARFFDGVSNADRVLWQGEAFNIKSVAPIGRQTGLELRCVRLS